MKKPKIDGKKNNRRTRCGIAARTTAKMRMNMSTVGIIRPKSDIATQNGAPQPCVRFLERFLFGVIHGIYSNFAEIYYIFQYGEIKILMESSRNSRRK
ncbi:hypothetical protein [Agrobacterium sp. B1(2019)]|uniref:hypothetical protein n=1 Tax=Agrobacterium sp. B1(2019) TaxID=2607032 RepID=UPI0016590182|nr:hypothetical protein [Agrobacterium sp. B1(2019)]